MTDLKELNKKTEEEKVLEENLKKVEESGLSEEELESVSGGIRPANPKDSRMV